jgi:hypothetical protein
MKTNEEKFLAQSTLEKKVYVKPEIIHELLLETRAGSEIPPLFTPPWISGGN